ncbi:MAG: signal peptidase II [Erysipelotrichaceae bacterium]|nr:signal peptidase II [Erysipelotrichaceae bacterium]
MRKRYIFEIIAIALMFVIDQFTKYLVTTNMFLGQEIVIIKNFFSLNYLRNTGAGFSIMEGQMTYFYIITCIALVILTILLLKSKNEHWLYTVAYTVMIGGTVGNFYDRIVNKYVIDFIDFIILGYDFPVFNFADIFLTVGSGLFILATILEYKGVIHADK